jgi:hypothetical protein
MNPQPPAPRRSSGGFLTVLLSVLAGLAALASVGMSPFFVMAADSCGVNNCDESRMTWAFALTWGGVALAVLVAVVGMVRAARRGSPTWVWPALALVLVIATFFGGFALAASVVRA